MTNLTKFLTIILIGFLASCSKEDKIKETINCSPVIGDSSSLHPKAVMFQAVLNDFVKRGLPGISVAIRDHHGLWLGSKEGPILHTKLTCSRVISTRQPV